MDVLGELLLGHVGDVVDGDDAHEQAERVDHGHRGPVVAGHLADGFLPVLVRAEADELVVHQVGDGRLGIGEQEPADVDVVEQFAGAVDDVDPVDRLGVVAVAADVVQGVGNGPVRADADVVGRHDAPDGLGVVAEDGLGDLAVERAEAGDQLARDFHGQLVEDGGAVVGVHGFDEPGGPLVAEFLEQVLLGLGREFRECVGGQLAGQHAEGDDGFVGFERVDQVGDVDRLEGGQGVTDLAEGALGDERLEFGFQQVGGGTAHGENGTRRVDGTLQRLIRHHRCTGSDPRSA